MTAGSPITHHAVSRKVLVLDDGNRGNLNQVLGIADRIPDLEVTVKKIPPLPILNRCLLLLGANLSDCLPGRTAGWLLKRVARLDLPADKRRVDGILSAGGRLAPLNLLSGRVLNVASIQVLFPELLRTGLFNLVIVPEHDLWRYRKIRTPANFLVVQGATNRIRATAPPPPEEERPLSLVVLIGGDDRHYQITDAWSEQLCVRLQEITGRGKTGVHLTTSRRTPPEAEKIFRQRLGNRPETFHLALMGEQDINPVAHLLAGADLVITTEDSINMVSESAGSGKPALVLRVGRKSRKRLVFDRALEKMERNGYLKLIGLEELTPELLSETRRAPAFRILRETEKASRAVADILKMSTNQ